MYTLENDRDTTSQFKKPKLAIKDEEVAQSSPRETDPVQPTGILSATQLSNVFKKLVLADTSQSGNKVAFATLIVTCVAVFFTALDQTVVVTALPQIIGD